MRQLDQLLLLLEEASRHRDPNADPWRQYFAHERHAGVTGLLSLIPRAAVVLEHPLDRCSRIGKIVAIEEDLARRVRCQTELVDRDEWERDGVSDEQLM